MFISHLSIDAGLLFLNKGVRRELTESVKQRPTRDKGMSMKISRETPSSKELVLRPEAGQGRSRKEAAGEQCGGLEGERGQVGEMADHEGS